MPTVSYHTLAGRIALTTVGTNRQECLADALGSVVTTTIGGAATGKQIRYANYGSVIYDVGGFNRPRNAWVGSYGYRSTQVAHAEQYVRARHYSTAEARWTTVDPVWPDERAYVYAAGNPSSWVDPSGRQRVPDPSGWPNWLDPGKKYGAETFRCLDNYANDKKNPKCTAALARHGLSLRDVMIAIIGCENRNYPSNTNPWSPDPGHSVDDPGGTGIGPARVNCRVHSEFYKFGRIDRDICPNVRAGIQIVCECLERNGGNIGGCGTGAVPSGGYDVISEPPRNAGRKNCFYQALDRLHKAKPR